MTAVPIRAGAGWLALRETADAAARAGDLVERLPGLLPDGRALVVHDLGCGAGAMARWLAARLAGRQHWVLHDRDDELLELAADHPPRRALDGAPVTAEVRSEDITRLGPTELADADLVVASALLDMLTAPELSRLLDACATAGCPVLVTLTVVGRVALAPASPVDQLVTEAFNAHQQRATEGVPRLGPAAAPMAAAGLSGRGYDVEVRPSPWRLGSDHSALAAEWFAGWFAAACEQRPQLADGAESYARDRLAQAAAGRLRVTVGHVDLLATPTP